MTSILVWWGTDEGGYAPRDWLPIALLLFAAAAVAVIAGPAPRPLRRPAAVACLAAAAFVVWSYLSVLWADDQATAWEGSHRTALYVLCFVVAALAPWTARGLVLAAGGFSLVLAGIGVVTLLRLFALDDVSEAFIDARLAEPLGYQNANAALWMLGAAPALVLGGSRLVPWWARPVFSGAAVLLLGLAVLSQSRGWLVSLPVVALATLLLAPSRQRLLVWSALPLLATAAALPSLLDVYTQGNVWPPDAAVLTDQAHAASRTLLAAVLVTVAAGLALVRLDLRVAVPERVTRTASRGLRIAAVVGAVAVVVGGLVAVDGRPLAKLDSAWTEFKDMGAEQQGESRFSSIGSTRYDFYRVGVEALRSAPLTGLGQDNFAQYYLLERTVPREEPRWTHSLVLRLLVHTGLIGFGLALALLVGVVLAVRQVRKISPTARLATAVAVLPAVVWVSHGAVDWLWEFPLLTCPVLALAGAATALDRPPAVVSSPGGRWFTIGLALVALPLAGMFAASWTAERSTARAISEWREDTPGAYRDLERAADLDPFAARPFLTIGAIASARGDWPRTEAAYRSAADRDPSDWFAQFKLGLLDGALGRKAAAETRLRRAVELNPRDALVREALARLRAGRPMGWAEAQREFQRRVQRRVQVTG